MVLEMFVKHTAVLYCQLEVLCTCTPLIDKTVYVYMLR